jgi:addiction module HigA family antidote
MPLQAGGLGAGGRVPLVCSGAIRHTPGEVIRESCFKPMGLTVTAAAEGLGVTRKAPSDLLNGHSGVSAEMAIRLEKAGWSTADAWLRMQLARDLWEARLRAAKIKVKKFSTEPAPT